MRRGLGSGTSRKATVFYGAIPTSPSTTAGFQASESSSRESKSSTQVRWKLNFGDWRDQAVISRASQVLSVAMSCLSPPDGKFQLAQKARALPQRLEAAVVVKHLGFDHVPARVEQRGDFHRINGSLAPAGSRRSMHRQFVVDPEAIEGVGCHESGRLFHAGIEIKALPKADELERLDRSDLGPNSLSLPLSWRIRAGGRQRAHNSQ